MHVEWGWLEGENCLTLTNVIARRMKTNASKIFTNGGVKEKLRAKEVAGKKWLESFASNSSTTQSNVSSAQ